MDKQSNSDAIDLHSALNQLVRVYQFRDHDKIQTCCEGLSVNQYYVIDMLIEDGTAGIIDLTKRLYLNKSSISRIVDQLVDQGYIEKQESPTDGRAIRLNITEKSMAIHKQITESEIKDLNLKLKKINPRVSRAAINLISGLAIDAKNEFL